MNDLFDLVIKLISLIKWVWDKGWTYQKHTHRPSMKKMNAYVRI